jgi:hypothetical protein
MDGGKLSAAIGVGLLCAGCASVEWPTPQEEVAVWLHEQPRVLAVSVDASLPTPRVLVRDHKAGERVGKGLGGAAMGAVMSLGAGCMYMGPFGCIAGVVVAPFAAVAGGVVGAVSVDSVDIPHPIIEAQGAPELYQLAVKPEEMQRVFTAALIAKGSDGEAVRLAQAAEGGGALGLSFSAVDLFGDVGEDPSVALLLGARVDVTTPDTTGYRYVELAYQSSRRRISEWKADEGKLLRDELASAADAMAEKAVQKLRTAPTSAAVEKVEHARDRRREAAAVAAAAPPAKLEFVPPPVTPVVPATPTVAAVAPSESPKVERPLGKVVGASWEYKFEDNIFSRRKHGFTVRAEAMEGGVVVESFQGEGGVRANERLTTRALAFSERRLLPGEKLVELGPYLLDPSLLDAVPEDYPLGESREAWRVSKSPVIAEKVSVPAGTFEAFRVQLSGERSASGFVGHSNPLWNSLGVTRFRYTAWYVPEVGRYVKAHHEQWNASGAQIADESVQLVAYRAP